MNSCWHLRAQDSFALTVLGILSEPLRYGAVAVPLFFVISGYCIHRSFVAKLQTEPDHAPHWGAYFLRRFWRIYPVLMGVLLTTFILDQFTLQRSPADPNLGSLSVHTLLVNLGALQGVAGPHFGSDGPLWSLAVELQLYALYPIIFYLARRRGIRACLQLTLLVSMACMALGLLPGFQSYLWFGPYWFCWTLGCAVAHLEIVNVEFRFKRYQWIIWFLISTLGFGLWLTHFSVFAYSCMACFWALIILKCLRGQMENLPTVPLSWLARLGVISYSLYAVHAPVCVFARTLFFQGAKTRNVLFICPVVLGCILVASVLFFLVERHSLRVPNWLRNALRLS
jgi:peptidoglycan/LPS O-acetylase OafA/YrhL